MSISPSITDELTSIIWKSCVVFYQSTDQNKPNFSFTIKCSINLSQQRMLKCVSECIFYKT